MYKQLKYTFVYSFGVILLPLILVLVGCGNNALDVDVSEIDVELRFRRFEKDLFQSDLNNMELEVSRLNSDYGLFFDLFTRRIVSIGGADNPNLAVSLKGFITDPQILEVYEETQLLYPELSQLENSIADAFKYYRYYFPNKYIPEVVTFVSGFNYAIVTTDSTLGIGLESYMGKDSKYYRMLGYPRYKVRNMNSSAIVPDCMRMIASSDYELKDSQKDLLSQMIHEGRILYFTEAMQPNIEDSLVIGFTAAQIQWCWENERNMWTFYLDKDILYSTEHTENIKYIGEGPFTSGFSNESPARTGQWVGWQVVRSYMSSNEVSVKELMEEENLQSILTKSNYKPRK
jgi:gliding motility-associated lipoprotein GldB